ncbi:MAG: DUF2252 domain-containing protein [Actinobacteria bacterium]|nr:MAG: DUF2252 domain-containing protein [Actinomycetota bacterium]
MGTIEKQVAAGGSKPLPYPTRAERIARGKAARSKVPRSAHGEIEFGEPRDPIALLEEQAASRVPELVPIRYGRMLASAFAFYRGGALIMAADLAQMPSSGLRVQSCGDAHLSNFGVFGSPERNLVFDINDFDETAPGPWEWDVKRLAASFAIGGRENGFSENERRSVVLETVGAYRKAMTAFSEMRNLEVWYSHLPVEQAVAEFTAGVDPKRLKKAEASIEKSRTKDSMHAFEKLTHVVDGERRIISDPPLIVPIDELIPASMQRHEIVGEIQGLVRSYRQTLETDRRHLLEQFRFVDMARKVVGVGSVGTRAWILLFMGVDLDDPLFLQVKEAQPSVLEQFVGKSEYKNSGKRVVAGQRLMQANTDIFLGWQHVSSGLDGKERDFYVRQLKDWKGSFEFEAAVPAGAGAYGKACGWTLARAHARSGDTIAIASYLGKSDTFDRAVADFAETYADQNERDYKALRDAVDSGRIKAETGL